MVKTTISPSMTRISSILVCNTLLRIRKLSILGSDRPEIHLYTACGFSNPIASWISFTVYPFSFNHSRILFPVSCCWIDKCIGLIIVPPRIHRPSRYTSILYYIFSFFTRKILVKLFTKILISGMS